MLGWISQWWPSRPGFVTVIELEEPLSIEPVSKLRPSSAVTVCATPSAFITTTRPGPTVTVLGLNAKSWILIVRTSLPGAAGGTWPLGEVDGGAAWLEPPEPTISAALTARAGRERARRWRSMSQTYGPYGIAREREVPR